MTPALVFTQNRSPEVVSADGNKYTTATGSLGWTLGKTVTETFTTRDYTLSQNFQQSDLSVISIANYELSYNVNV